MKTQMDAAEFTVTWVDWADAKHEVAFYSERDMYAWSNGASEGWDISPEDYGSTPAPDDSDEVVYAEWEWEDEGRYYEFFGSVDGVAWVAAHDAKRAEVKDSNGNVLASVNHG